MHTATVNVLPAQRHSLAMRSPVSATSRTNKRSASPWTAAITRFSSSRERTFTGSASTRAVWTRIPAAGLRSSSPSSTAWASMILTGAIAIRTVFRERPRSCRPATHSRRCTALSCSRVTSPKAGSAAARDRLPVVGERLGEDAASGAALIGRSPRGEVGAECRRLGLHGRRRESHGGADRARLGIAGIPRRLPLGPDAHQ